ncbi:MAG: hypothetical protein JWM28_2523, partial [Chitinophagaceae bacterium]|nr:hypothetical protein [Chitinophagaceae bacterium]
NRVFPKVDKVLEFEKALTAHAQKYHTGDWKWRVFEIQSGPDFGGYHITEGPVTWDQIDGRGNLGTEHNNDWNKTVALYLADRSSSGYRIYREDLSTVQLTDYSDKIAITHLYPNVGFGDKVEEILKKVKKAWENGKQTVAVYESSSSGPAEFLLVNRYKQGLKERNKDFRKPFKERYNASNGEDSFDAYLDGVRKYIDKAWSELLFYRADLSSK